MRFLGRHYLIEQRPLQIPFYMLDAFLTLPATALVVASVQWLRRRTPPRETAILAVAGLAILAALGLNDLMLKPLFGRSSVADFFRTPPRFTFTFFNGDLDATFPSGHAAMALAFLAVLWRYYPRWRWLQASLAATLLLSLVVTRDHYLSDVLAGALVGAMIGNLVGNLSWRIIGSTPAGSGLWR